NDGVADGAPVTVRLFVGGNVLSIDDARTDEGNTGTRTMTFTVTLAPASSSQATVQVQTQDGTATPGSDYVAPPPTPLTFGARPRSGDRARLAGWEVKRVPHRSAGRARHPGGGDGPDPQRRGGEPARPAPAGGGGRHAGAGAAPGARGGGRVVMPRQHHAPAD